MGKTTAWPIAPPEVDDVDTNPRAGRVSRYSSGPRCLTLDPLEGQKEGCVAHTRGLSKKLNFRCVVEQFTSSHGAVSHRCSLPIATVIPDLPNDPTSHDVLRPHQQKFVKKYFGNLFLETFVSYVALFGYFGIII
jgi:hypothetical protein